MTDGYNYNKDFDQSKMVAELLLKVTVLENLLINKQIITEDEIKEQFYLLAIKINNIISSEDDILPFYEPNKILAVPDPNAEIEALLKEFNLDVTKISKDN